MTGSDQPSEIFSLSDRAVDVLAADNPVLATYDGVAGHDHRWPDLSPQGAAEALERHRELRAEALGLHAAGKTASDSDQLACRVLVDACDDAIAAHDAKLHLTDLNNTDSPHQHLRQVFEVQAATSRDDWEAIIERLETIDTAIAGYRATLDAGLRTGHLVCRRQIGAAIEQGSTAAGPSSSFEALRPRLAAAGLDQFGDRLDRAIGGARRLWRVQPMAARRLPSRRPTRRRGR